MKLRFIPSLFLLVLICLVAGCYGTKPMIYPNAKLTSKETMEHVDLLLQNGDWLMTYSKDVQSITKDTPFSLVGIYDEVTKKVLLADVSGVRAIPLTQLFAESRRVVAIRPVWSTDVWTPKAVERAWELVGTKLGGVAAPEQQHFSSAFLSEVYRPFSPVGTRTKGNVIPTVIHPNNLHHWGRVVFDFGN